MKEADTRAELIEPALKEAGWGIVESSRIAREEITKGRLLGGGKRGKIEIADFVLYYKGQKLAVIEAKRRDLPVGEGVAQAKRYAERLQTRFCYSTNGLEIYQIDMETGAEGKIEAFPTPDQLWGRIYLKQDEWRESFGKVPFENKSGNWEPRYYQHNAINKTLEALITGKNRILLTLATGTGKTSIAFQIAWKLFHSRWNLSRKPIRHPRILFLADRNILANQAFNDFSPFPEDAIVRIDPEVIKKRGKVPKNGSVFFTIFQTFMTGRDENDQPAPKFGDYPPDFFDFIIIDECHRGGANDESTWRGILEYFSPAIQLGLTATPKRKNNADTYAYFGDPVYIYSLKQGINDGYLTPFKVVQIGTTLDEYIYTSDDQILDGEIDENKRYTESDFNRTIEIEEREKQRVKIFMDAINQSEKTLVFCATQEHAGLVRDLINQIKTNRDPNYCVRVTANDGAYGEQLLKQFQNNDKTIPTILTTSKKLSTGVNARNIRNIVLMRPVNSMIEFKQIVGRGTRLFDGKDYFTIYDFVKAYYHFNDTEWDGEPVEPEGPTSKACTGINQPEGKNGGFSEEDKPDKPQRIKIKLADGKERNLQHMQATTFWDADTGKPISATDFIEKLYGTLPEYFKNEDSLRELWSNPETRKALLNQLGEKGFGVQELSSIKQMINAEKSDLYDVLAYIAFALPPMTRQERVNASRINITSSYDEKIQAFLDFVLEQYIREDVSELDSEKLPDLLKIKYNSTRDAASTLGGIARIKEAFIGFQKFLYK